MRPANVRGRTNPVNAAALPGQHLALSTGRRLIQAARNAASQHAGMKRTAVTVMLPKITVAAELVGYVKKRS